MLFKEADDAGRMGGAGKALSVSKRRGNHHNGKGNGGSKRGGRFRFSLIPQDPELLVQGAAKMKWRPSVSHEECRCVVLISVRQRLSVKYGRKSIKVHEIVGRSARGGGNAPTGDKTRRRRRRRSRNESFASVIALRQSVFLEVRSYKTRVQ